jgi:signal transduction histidine kinase
VAANTDKCDKFEELQGVLVRELQRTQEVAHKLRNDLTAISGYAEIMVLRLDPERAARELRKLLDGEEIGVDPARLHRELARGQTQIFTLIGSRHSQ